MLSLFVVGQCYTTQLILSISLPNEHGHMPISHWFWSIVIFPMQYVVCISCAMYWEKKLGYHKNFPFLYVGVTITFSFVFISFRWNFDCTLIIRMWRQYFHCTNTLLLRQVLSLSLSKSLWMCTHYVGMHVIKYKILLI